MINNFKELHKFKDPSIEYEWRTHFGEKNSQQVEREKHYIKSVVYLMRDRGGLKIDSLDLFMWTLDNRRNLSEDEYNFILHLCFAILTCREFSEGANDSLNVIIKKVVYRNRKYKKLFKR